MEHPSTLARSSALQAVLLSVLGAAIGAAAGFGAEAQLRGALTGAGFQLDGAEVVASTPKEFDAFLKAEMQNWGKVIKDAGIKAER